MYKNWRFRKFMKKRNKEADERFYKKMDKKIINSLIDDGILKEELRL